MTIHASLLCTEILYLKKYIGDVNGNGIGNRNDGNRYNGDEELERGTRNGERGTGTGNGNWERGRGNKEQGIEIGNRNDWNRYTCNEEWEQGIGIGMGTRNK